MKVAGLARSGADHPANSARSLARRVLNLTDQQPHRSSFGDPQSEEDPLPVLVSARA